MANKKLICMHEQNFEKQVQQKMEELSLMPSAPVWQKVEEQIRKKKDRRHLIFWLLPLLLAGGSAWWLLSGTNDRVATNSTVSVTKKQPVPAATAPASSPESSAPSTRQEEVKGTPSGQSQSASTSGTIKYNNLTIRTNLPKLPAQPNLPHRINRSGNQETPPSLGETTIARKSEGTLTSLKKEEEPRKEALVSRPETTIRTETNTVSGTATDSASSREAVAVTEPKEVIPPATPVVTPSPSGAVDSNTLAPAAPQELNIRKWEWTVHAEAGVTSVLAELFELPSTRNYDAFSSPAQFTSGNFFAYYPSQQEAGPAFSAGATAKRRISSRLKLTAGIQYNYYSTQLAVGQQKNAATATAATVPFARQATAADNAYLPGVQNDYTNRYHFIQLPVGLEYRVLRNLPLQVQGGIAVAHLVKTNALSYDYQAQAYYEKLDAYNATQLHLFTNFNYTVWKGKSKKLDVGPYVQYSLTELQKTAPDKNRLFSTGLRTQVSF